MQETIRNEVRRTRKRKQRRRFLWVIPLAVLAVVYLAGALFFSRNFLPNTTINGQDVGGKSIKAVTAIYNEIGIAELAQQKIEHYFAESRKYLDRVGVSAEKKQELIAYTNRMMNRQY